MRSSWGRAGWFGWFFVFLFPFAIYFLAWRAAGARAESLPGFWPVLFFYGLAIGISVLALVVARLFFRTLPASYNREPIVRGIFLIPLIPGVAYLALFGMKLLAPGQEVPNQTAAPLHTTTRTPQSTAPRPSTSTPAPAGADMSPPTIALVGNAAMDITQGSFWADPGATAADAKGTDLTPYIAITGVVNTNIAGLYTLEYSVVDKNGSSATVSRLVHVSAPTLNRAR